MKPREVTPLEAELRWMRRLAVELVGSAPDLDAALAEFDAAPGEELEFALD